MLPESGFDSICVASQVSICSCASFQNVVKCDFRPSIQGLLVSTIANPVLNIVAEYFNPWLVQIIICLAVVYLSHP